MQNLRKIVGQIVEFCVAYKEILQEDVLLEKNNTFARVVTGIFAPDPTTQLRF